MLGPKDFLTLTLVPEVLFFALPIARFTLLRHKKRGGLAEIVSDVFYLLGCIIAIMNGIFICHFLVKEIHVRKKIHDEFTVYVLVNNPQNLKGLFWVGVGYNTEMWAFKMAFLTFYTGLYDRVQTRLRYLVYIVYCIAVATYIANIVSYLTFCFPVNRNWTNNLEELCIASTEFVPQTIMATTNIATDLMILALPILVIRRLRLTSKQSHAIILVFVVGGLSFITTMIRYIILNTSGAMKKSKDQLSTMFSVHLFLWLPTVEVLCAMLAFTMPAFWTLIARQIQSRQGTSARSGSNGPGGRSIKMQRIGKAVLKSSDSTTQSTQQYADDRELIQMEEELVHGRHGRKMSL